MTAMTIVVCCGAVETVPSTSFWDLQRVYSLGIGILTACCAHLCAVPSPYHSHVHKSIGVVAHNVLMLLKGYSDVKSLNNYHTLPERTMAFCPRDVCEDRILQDSDVCACATYSSSIVQPMMSQAVV